MLYTVYLDQVFFGNLLINYLILWATAKLSQTKAGSGRLLAGALLGACYTLVLFVPGADLLLTIWFKFIAAALIISLTFAPMRLKRFCICLGTFYLTSFVFGGLVLGIAFYFQPYQLASINGTGLVLTENFWYGLLLGATAFCAVVRVVTFLLENKIAQKLFRLGLFVRFQGVQIRVDAFLDTGNQLLDPMTGQAVMVVEYDALKPLLPAEVKPFFEQAEEPDVWHVLNALSDHPWRARFRAIPFFSLGRSQGLMLGFRPDEVYFKQNGRRLQVEKVVIAIYHKEIDPGNAYNALLHPRLLETP